jgi:hypothetical protein
MVVRTKGGGSTSFSIQDIQKLTFSGIGTGVDNERVANVIRTFSLLQNFPNPFNPTTTIEYQLPKTGIVRIKIFNINGQLVKAFEIKDQNSGTHAVVWDGKNNGGQNVATGMYICQVAFENSVLAKKMLFIK